MKHVLRLAFLDATRTIVSWRWLALVGVLAPVLWVVLDPNQTHLAPDGVERLVPAAIGDAIPHLWGTTQRHFVLFVLPLVLLGGSIVGDDRAAGGPMVSVTRVGGTGRWWLAKVVAIAAITAVYVATYFAVVLVVAAIDGFALSLEPSAYSALMPSERYMELLPGHNAVGTSLLLAPIGWFQLLPIVLLSATAGMLTRNRVIAYAVPIALIVWSLFNATNSAAATWVSPLTQLNLTRHDPARLTDTSVPWGASLAVTGAWIVVLTAVGWVAARRVDL